MINKYIKCFVCVVGVGGGGVGIARVYWLWVPFRVGVVG